MGRTARKACSAPKTATRGGEPLVSALKVHGRWPEIGDIFQTGFFVAANSMLDESLTWLSCKRTWGRCLVPELE
jgi:hypothetical protein